MDWVDHDAEFRGRIALPVRFDGDMADGLPIGLDDEVVTGLQDAAKLGFGVRTATVPCGQRRVAQPVCIKRPVRAL